MAWYDYQLTFEFDPKLTQEQADKIAPLFNQIYFVDTSDMCPQGELFMIAKLHSVCAQSGTDWRDLCIKLGRSGVSGKFYVAQETEGTCGTLLRDPIVWVFGPNIDDPEEEQSRLNEQARHVRVKDAFMQFKDTYTAMINIYESKNPQDCDWNAIVDLLRLDLRGTARIEFYAHCVGYFMHEITRKNTGQTK